MIYKYENILKSNIFLVNDRAIFFNIRIKKPNIIYTEEIAA